MATRKRRDDNERDDDRDDDDERGEGAGGVTVHQAYLEHRLAGGEPGDADAYRRGLEQFERLPGAVPGTPPTSPPPPGPDDDVDRPNDNGGVR